MSLEHAILGFLRYAPFSGYDLKKLFDTSVQHFWPADQSQIYRTLARLADDGLAEVEVVEQEDRPDRKVYHITEAGREELYRWLTSPLEHEETRSAALIHVFFAAQLSDEEILAMFHQAADQMRELLDHYAQVPQEAQSHMKTSNTPRDWFFWMLTLESGIQMAQAQLEWIESVIERIENKEHPPR
jgi:DNA-binding PadR family transcriptional regulator